MRSAPTDSGPDARSRDESRSLPTEVIGGPRKCAAGRAAVRHVHESVVAIQAARGDPVALESRDRGRLPVEGRRSRRLCRPSVATWLGNATERHDPEAE